MSGGRSGRRVVCGGLGERPGAGGGFRWPVRAGPLGHCGYVWRPVGSRPTLDALRYAATVSDRVIAVWVRPDDGDPEPLRQAWQRSVGDNPRFELQILESPYASLITPFVDFVETVEASDPDQTLTIVMPIAIPRYRFDSLLLNQRAINMRQALDQRHNRVFTMVRYYLPT